VSCDDGDACTTADTCDGTGACVGGAPPNCDDGNGCTDDSCNSLVGCQNVANTDPCDDANACTTLDTCNNKSCVGGPPLDCNDQNDCTSDSCNPVSGCAYSNVSGACDDGNACTTTDHCSAGACTGGPPRDCNDGNICTDDSCDALAGCINSPNTVPCDDGNECTTADTCAAGDCAGGPPPDCDDGNVCTNDSCDPFDGCFSAPNTASCDDGDATTLGDTCGLGSCQAGTLACPQTPMSQCRTSLIPAKSALVMVDGSTPDTDKIKWAWKAGEATATEDFGDPSSTTDYLLCIYDDAAGTPGLLVNAALPASSNWSANSRGYQFRNIVSASSISKVKLKAGVNGRAAIIMAGIGPNLGIDLPIAIGSGITAQLIKNDMCWEASFGAPVFNTDTKFKARGTN